MPIVNAFRSLLLSFFLTFSNASVTRILPSVQPIQSPEGISFCSAFSVNQRERLYVTAAHCVDNHDVDLPIPLMFSQRIRVMKVDHLVDVAIVQAALGTRPLMIAEQPPGPGGAVVAAGFIGGQVEPAMVSAFTGTFYANAFGMDQKHQLHVFSVFHVRVEHGMSGGPILDREGQVVSIVQLKFPEDMTGGILPEFLHAFMAQ